MKAISFFDADVVSGGNHSGYRSEIQDQMCVYIYIYYRLDPEVCRMKKVKARMKQNRGEEKEKVRRNKEHKNVGSEEK